MSTEHMKLSNWVRIWKKAGARLDEIKSEELSKMSDDDTRAALYRIMHEAPVSVFDTSNRPITGLVEQQAFFKRLRS